MSDYNTGKLLFVGKGLAPYRSYLVGGTCIFDSERYDSLAKTVVGSSIAGDGLLSGHTIDQRGSGMTYLPLSVQGNISFDLDILARQIAGSLSVGSGIPAGKEAGSTVRRILNSGSFAGSIAGFVGRKTAYIEPGVLDILYLISARLRSRCSGRSRGRSNG